MASAFANNTQHMNSSDKISNSKAKTNYNYLRLVSKTNRKSTSCYEDYKTSSSLKVDSLKNYEKSNDFQLEFYYLAMSEIYKTDKVNAFYYD